MPKCGIGRVTPRNTDFKAYAVLGAEEKATAAPDFVCFPSSGDARSSGSAQDRSQVSKGSVRTLYE
jgi:hypothetical protein